MSQLIEVLKYLFDFLKVYKASSSVNVLKWKEADMENSFKWAAGAEEIYKKVKKRKWSPDFIEKIKVFKVHWNIEENIDDLITNATFLTKKSLITNKNLSDELRIKILESICEEINKKDNIEDDKLSELNDDKNELLHKLFEFELDKLCLKLVYQETDSSLIDLLLDFAINQKKNLDLILKLLDRIKLLDHDKYSSFFLKLFNKKFEIVLLLKDWIQVFDFENQPEILNAYFCYLIYIFTCIIKEFDLSKKTVNDQIDFNSSTFDLNMLISHFRNALNQTSDRTFLRILKQNSKSNSSWNFIISRLKD